MVESRLAYSWREDSDELLAIYEQWEDVKSNKI